MSAARDNALAMAVVAPIRLLVDTGRSGAENMRLDEALLDACAADGPAVVRLYWFAPPCLSLGRLQADADVDGEACRRDGVDVVRRPTGGRAVLHDQEVTYAVVCRVDDDDLGGDVSTSCARIHALVAAGLRRLGVPTLAEPPAADERAAARDRALVADCFARPAAQELLGLDGRKLVGSAQARRGAALLQHGSVLLDPPRAGTYLRGGDAPARGTGVRSLLGRPVSREELVEALADGFAAGLGTRCRR